MTYSAEIRRNNPTCFLFLVDQSSSMQKPFGVGDGKTKADGVAGAINRLLQNLTLKCTKSQGVRDYCHVGIIGYGGRFGPALSGALTGRRLVPISEIAKNPLRIEQRTRKVDDGAGGVMDQPIKFPVWFDPAAHGKTPMCQALQLAQEVLTEFLRGFPQCYPPLVINITDGAATDGNPEAAAASVRALSSTDGNALLFNAHLSSKQLQRIEYPDREEGLPDDHARLLFRMSSQLPPKLQAAAKAEGFMITPASRGFVFNANLMAIVRFMDIGTRIAVR